MAEPSVRASLVKMVLRRAAEVWPGDAAAIHAALGPAALARLEETPGHEWVPIAIEAAIVRAVHAKHGDEGARRLGIAIGRGIPGHPLLRPLAAATFGMLGRHPAALVAVGAAAWSVATRDAGRVAGSRRGASEGIFLVDGLPDVLRERCWLVRMGGAGEGVLAIAGLATESWVDWEPGSASARVTVSWRRPE
jgi:hypothetical protein